MNNSDDTLYDTRALNITQWNTNRDSLLAGGWEYLPPLAGVVYIRKHLRGPVHIPPKNSRTWLSK